MNPKIRKVVAWIMLFVMIAGIASSILVYAIA